jgi:hypothetical protein
MAMGVHGLSKVSPGPAMPYPSMRCGRETPETAVVARPQGRRPAAVFTLLDTPRRTPMIIPEFGGVFQRKSSHDRHQLTPAQTGLEDSSYHPVHVKKRLTINITGRL